MPHWKEFKAWVTVDGKEAPEYAIEMSEDQKTVTCWIASELGKTFSVNWTNVSFHGSTVGEVKMDGNSCGGKLIFGRTLPSSAFKNGVTDGTTLKAFMFSSLALTDDDAYLPGGPSRQLEDLGVIELNIYPVHPNTSRIGVSTTSKDLSALKVHERSKKAVTQQITLGQAERLAVPVTFTSSKRTGPDLVKFFFKYRPIDILRANGIAPQNKRKASELDPASTPVQEKKVSREKIEKVDGRIKKESKHRIKQEGPIIDLTENTRSTKKVKRERRPFIQGEIIDLT
ncbi:hypothetical protein C8R44DRAFT_763065 [Mycena epipterygia]|nr:hypothetical protein C8R44DRAFT_763065 [Mycena epipterygia]